MRQVTVNIPEEKYEFFIDLIDQLGFHKDEEIEIPEEHKRIVLERIRLSKQEPTRLLDWEEVKDDFKFD